MRVYVAATFASKLAARGAMFLLGRHGHVITHDWTREDATGMSGAALDCYMASCAQGDLVGVRNANALVLINDAVSATGGKWVEFGIALALGKLIVLVQPDDSMPKPIFSPFAYTVRSIEEAVEYLDAIEAAATRGAVSAGLSRQ